MKISIIGAGKLGTDIFNYLLNYDFTLSLICKDDKIASTIKNKTLKKIERFKKTGIINQAEYDNKVNDAIICTDLERTNDSDIIIEAITENFKKKKELFNRLERIINNNSIICSNSSSFLPSELAPSKEWLKKIIGLHFFYPVKLKSIVEIIKNENTNPDIISKINGLLKTINKYSLELEENNAFMLNKIYLDIQALAYNLCIDYKLEFKAFDNVIKENLFPIGIFEFIDSVGADIILTSTKNYIKTYKNKSFYLPLVNKLEEQVLKNTGFYSEKNNAGNKRLPKKSRIIDKILYTLINSTYKIVENKIASFEKIDHAMKEYLDLEKGPIELSKEIGLEKIHDTLLNFYNESNKEIFSTSKLLKS